MVDKVVDTVSLYLEDACHIDVLYLFCYENTQSHTHTRLLSQHLREYTKHITSISCFLLGCVSNWLVTEQAGDE